MGGPQQHERRDGGGLMTSRPEWLYGSGCCEKWTPADGCWWHTGRMSMSLKARALDGDEWLRAVHGITPESSEGAE